MKKFHKTGSVLENEPKVWEVRGLVLDSTKKIGSFKVRFCNTSQLPTLRSKSWVLAQIKA